MKPLTAEQIKLLNRVHISNTVYNAPVDMGEKQFYFGWIFHLFKDCKTLEDFEEVVSGKNFTDLFLFSTDTNNKVFFEIPSLRTMVYLLNRFVDMVHAKIPDYILSKYLEKMNEVSLLLTLGEGIVIPDRTKTLKSIIEAWDFLLNYDEYIPLPIRLENSQLDLNSMYYYKVDLTRMIDQLLPYQDEDKYDRAMFQYLLRIPH